MTSLGRHTITDEVDVERLRPLADHVLVRVLERERTDGGIILLKSKGTECCISEVVRVGTGVENPLKAGWFPIELKPGDTVLSMEYAGERVEIREGAFRFIRSRGIWAKVKLKGLGLYDLLEIEPRMDCVVLDPVDESMSKEGLHLVDPLRESQNRRGTVIKIGPGMWDATTGKRNPVGYEPGQQVVFMRYAGADVMVNGKKLRILVEDDIRCGVEGME